MKKYFLILLAILPMLLFSACSSNDKEVTASLNGTTWVAPEDGDGLRTMRFTEKEFIFTIVYNGEVDTDGGTYTYTPPFVNFTAINRDTHKLETTTGKIEGKKLTLGEITYFKQ